MKIALIEITATVFYGGIQTGVWNFARELAQMGCEVTVIGGTGAIRPDDLGAVTVRTYPFVQRARFPNLGTRFRKFAERWSFARCARADVAAADYDWIVLHKPLDFFWPRLLPARSRTRYAFYSGGTDFMPFDRRLGRRIDAWLACSHFNAWQLANRYGHFPTVTFNGVDTTRFAPHGDGRALREALGFAAEDVVFAFAGRVVGWKGLAVAIRALGHAHLAGLPARLLIIGDGPERAKLQALAAQLDVAPRVRFHQAVPHARLPQFYSAADAGVFPSIGDEAFGITIAEAMSCARPVVASYVGGIPEVVGNEGSCGLLVGPGDAAGLAHAMRSLAVDAGQRERMGQAARARIEANFTWRAAAGRLLAALERAEPIGR